MASDCLELTPAEAFVEETVGLSWCRYRKAVMLQHSPTEVYEFGSGKVVFRVTGPPSINFEHGGGGSCLVGLALSSGARRAPAYG